MAQTVNLDAMIPRADFCEHDSDAAATVKKIQDISLAQLDQGSFLVPILRKPDFQRETTQWDPSQIVIFLKSFLDNELVPSIILWKSPKDIFIIDGAHRISALLAWINDDYGDGALSKNFFGDNISDAQKKVAVRVRNLIQREIGSYTEIKKVMLKPELAAKGSVLESRANNATTRALDLQWVEGDAGKAETSFFKINKQGTPLHPTEERLLRQRTKPIAIASRSTVRAGSGHKYWDQFEPSTQAQIETKAKELFGLIFSPELSFPIKTLNLPHGGQASPINAYNLLMDFIAYSSVGNLVVDDDHSLYVEDIDGSGTLDALEKCISVMMRMTSNVPKSLGLHPAVYFYSERGRHMDTIFLGFIKVFADAIRNNDKDFFKKFTARRSLIEKVFLENKFLLFQVNSLFGSKQRVDKWGGFFIGLVNNEFIDVDFTRSDILAAVGMEDKVISENTAESGVSFSTATKSAIFLQQSLNSATKCPLCGGFVHVEKAVQYDHIEAKSNGGSGSLDNIQITHPYCNSIKGGS